MSDGCFEKYGKMNSPKLFITIEENVRFQIYLQLAVIILPTTCVNGHKNHK